MRTHLTFNQLALIALHTKWFSLHFGVYRNDEPDSLYRFTKTGEAYYITVKHWLWGRATEPYDLLLDYYGCGPLFLVVVPR
jgi:hypothetical protein